MVGASGGTGSVLMRELSSRGRRVPAISRGGQADLPAGENILGGRWTHQCSAVAGLCLTSRPFRGGSTAPVVA